MSVDCPATEREAADLVKGALARQTTLAIEGGGTRAGLGRPMQAAAGISTRRLAGVVFYEPAEMVICARAGTPLAEIEQTLGEKGQTLPFEPMDHRGLYGVKGEPTIGAVAAANISGPRRIRNGAARDSLIGVRFINGRGETIKSGGRVMKNVTGLDLVKLQCGAHGTLGLLTEVTFKVIPAPASSGTLVVKGLDDSQAVAAMAEALGSPFEVSAAAHIPGAPSWTMLRIEHFAPSVDYRLGELARSLAKYGACEYCDHERTQTLWRDVRDGVAFHEDRSQALWRVSLAPMRAPAFLRALSGDLALSRYQFDWGGGLIWLAVDDVDDAGAQRIRAALEGLGGHATLVRASVSTRAAVDVFHPQSSALMKISRGIKKSLDPTGLFNPGRMYLGV